MNTERPRRPAGVATISLWLAGSQALVCSKLGDFCLDIKDGLYTPGAELIVWTCKNTLNQQWQWTAAHALQSQMNNMCADLKSDS